MIFGITSGIGIIWYFFFWIVISFSGNGRIPAPTIISILIGFIYSAAGLCMSPFLYSSVNTLYITKGLQQQGIGMNVMGPGAVVQGVPVYATPLNYSTPIGGGKLLLLFL
jgi:hypothetical protein